MEKLIDIEHVTAAYGNKTVLRDISLTIWKDDFLGIIGPNGGGKTTLLKVILGLLPPVSGVIRFYEDGRIVPSLRIGYLPQLNNIDKKFPISVREVVTSGLASEKPLFRSYSASQKQRVEEVLGKMGLEDLANRAIGELSGGQLQRVCIARAVACQPEIILFDEAISSLDAHTQIQIMDLLHDLKEKLGLTYIFITHDLTSVTYLCDDVLFLYHGRITEHIPVSRIAETKDDYARKLLASIIEFN